MVSTLALRGWSVPCRVPRFVQLGDLQVHEEISLVHQDVQYTGVYHDSCGGYLEYIREYFVHTGKISLDIGEYHEYTFVKSWDRAYLEQRLCKV